MCIAAAPLWKSKYTVSGLWFHGVVQPRFYHSHCCPVCNNVSYRAVLYRVQFVWKRLPLCHCGWTPFRFYVRPEVFHDVSLMYDKCFSGIFLMYDKCSSGICLMFEPIRTKSGVFVHRVERSSHAVRILGSNPVSKDPRIESIRYRVNVGLIFNGRWPEGICYLWTY